MDSFDDFLEKIGSNIPPSKKLQGIVKNKIIPSFKSQYTQICMGNGEKIYVNDMRKILAKMSILGMNARKSGMKIFFSSLMRKRRRAIGHGKAHILPPQQPIIIPN